MQIGSSTASAYAIDAGQGADRRTAGAAAASMATVPAARSSVETADFTSMTRQQLADWVNGEIKAGRMTLHESSPFVGMTIKIDVNGGGQDDMKSDPTRLNFMELTRRGIDGAQWRNDKQSEDMLKQALTLMQRAQGAVVKIDKTA